MKKAVKYGLFVVGILLCLVIRECQKVWGSAGFVRIYGHMIHRRPIDTGRDNHWDAKLL